MELRSRLVRGYALHNLIVLSGRLDRIPWPVVGICCLSLAGSVAWLFGPLPGPALGLLVGVVLTDALLLAALPLLGISFGSWGAPLTVFTLGRLVLAAPLALLPAPYALAALAAVELSLTLCSLWGHLVAPFRLEVVPVRAPILGRPVARPIRVVMVSDLHLERPTRRERQVLARCKALDPDLILFGGDLLNLSYVDDPRAYEEAGRFLTALGAIAPLRLVLGNPTVEDRVQVPALYAELGVHRLEAETGAERLTIRGASLVLFGLSASLKVKRDLARLQRVVDGTPVAPEEATVLLYHMPDLAPLLPSEGAGGRRPAIDLMLCGHTHGGQICVPGLGPVFTASGAHRRLSRGTHVINGTLLHTNRGLGLEGLGAPRMRFWARPEITLVELVER